MQTLLNKENNAKITRENSSLKGPPAQSGHARRPRQPLPNKEPNECYPLSANIFRGCPIPPGGIDLRIFNANRFDAPMRRHL
jgi:hypothetical protein